MDSTKENRHLGIISDSRSTIRQLLKKYYFQEQNKQKKFQGEGKDITFCGLGGGFLILFFFFSFFGLLWSIFVFFFFFSIFPRMERSEKNKINHLSIVFSGMSSVSLGWGVGGV